ncbi:hypothetical protein ACLQ2R_26700 [Streptosporangium sp. DT93]|uniref:hypothetical protein n=1 Tax=Streptosporangium sp. DT93 TaxID=3393428 RepID=UPI003CF62396
MTEYLSINGNTIAYDVTGEGPLVVLAHGMGDSRHSYRFIVPALVAAGYRQIGPPLVHRMPVRGVTFSRDSSTLATGDDKGKIRLWDVRPVADLFTSVCAAAVRSLTKDEWPRYLPASQGYLKVC